MRQPKQWTILLGALLLLSPTWAQQAEPFLFTTGTSWEEEGTGRNWAWIQFQTPDLAELQNRPFAIYSRPGRFDTPGTYELRSVVEPQLDPRVIAILLEQSTKLGGDLFVLESDVTALFQDLNLDPSLPLQTRISALILGAQNDPEAFENLMLLSRKHPALALATGMAFAMPIDPGFTSFEIREWSPALGQAGAVVGRVEVEAGNPRILPAPVNLTEVIDESPRGNLNAKLRWDEPAALQRVALLHFGFDVIRMDPDFAESPLNSYDVTPPTPEVLKQLLIDNPGIVDKVNRLPVMISDDVEEGGAYFVDDNNGFAEGGTQLEDGDEFYYFITAKDILGRNGLVSDGIKVRICDRYPPKVPVDVRVEQVRYFNPETQQSGDRLRIRWRQNPDNDRDTTTEYKVFKWNSPADPGFRGLDIEEPPLSIAPFAIVPHVPGQTWAEVFDDEVEVEDGNPTYMYTVRALDDSQCEPNESGHSGAGIGNRFDWAAPAAPTAEPRITCLKLVSLAKEVVAAEAQEGEGRFMAVLQRPAGVRNVDWAEVRWMPGENPPPESVESSALVGNLSFRRDELERRIEIPAPQDVPVTVYVRFGQGLSRVSNWAQLSASKNESTEQQVDFVFEANELFILTAVDEDCRVFEFPEPGGEGPPPDEEYLIPNLDDDLLLIGLPGPADEEGLAQLKVFQQVDDGDLDLIETVTLLDEVEVAIELAKASLPNTCARIRFYVQLVNTNGFEGEYGLVEEFFMGREDASAPLMRAPQPRGTALQPEARFRWYTPAHGVRDFVVYVGMLTQPPDQISPELSENILDPGTTRTFLLGGQEVELITAAYLTPLVDSGFGNLDTGEFDLTFPIELGTHYTVAVASRTLCGESDPSEAVRFQWNQPYEEGPEVPWPAREIPPVVNADLFPGLQSIWLPENEDTEPLKLNQLAIRIGAFPWLDSYGDTKSESFEFKGADANLQQFLISGILNGENLFPLVVYRRQLPSAKLPDVSGDVAQVSPLMEQIAFQLAGEFTILRDPFIRALPEFDTGDPSVGYIYLLDTQPVIRGATYQHILVQFDERKEPVRVIPLEPVEVPQ